jgi:type IV pilus assembly protein PilM
VLKFLNDWLRKTSRSKLGIDISSTSIKLIELSKFNGEYRLESYCIEPLPPQAMEGHLIKNLGLVSETLQRMIAQSSISGRHAAIAVPDSSVITKVVQVNDGLSDEELEELVLMEADKYIQYPLDEINIDFDVVGPSSKNPAVLDILIVASRAEIVADRVNVLSNAGLEAQVVDVESYAAGRAIEWISKNPEKIIVVVDIGAFYTNMMALHDDKIIFKRDEEFGVCQLTNQIAQKYSVSVTEAEQKKNAGTLPSDYETTLMNPFIGLISTQIKRMLQFFYSSTHHSSVDLVYLAGGGALLPNIATLVEQALGIPTRVANPFENMLLSPTIHSEDLFSKAPALLIACGLALRTNGL